MSTTLRHHYRPRGAAAEVFASRAPEVLLSGPAGTGKSRAALEKLHAMMLATPGARGLIVRKTLVSLGSTGLVTWREKVAAESIAAGHVVWYGGSQQEAAAYRYSNGSTVVVGGLDKPQKVMSSEYDFIFVQEAIELTIDDWEALTTRLRNGRISFQQLIADCNPWTPSHWLKQRADRGDTLMLHSRHEDNPTLFREDGTLTEGGEAYIGKLEKLTGVRYHRLRHGRWVAAEGLIYEEFDPAVHVVERFDIPESWTRWWTVDFGFTNPFVLQCWAEDPDGRLYLYREIYKTRTLVEDHAKHILRLVRECEECCKSRATDHDCHECKACRLVWAEPRPRAIICDHDAEDRATLERHLGMSTIAARKGVSDGIQATQARFRPAGDGRPRIFFLRDALVERDPELEDAKKPCSTAEEITGYVWDTSPGKPPKETPVKQDDHGMDAARYMVAQKDLGARPRIRTLGR
ncbi:phage terminase large subunit [Nonomuraea sp. NPDC050643]|uniref:phage terminase large subunit n=1 Tax=Nonomuraea sp. NPDC050643 TaxID=3155660 RepID=UPI0033F3D3E9